MKTVITVNESLDRLGAASFPEEARLLLARATARERHGSRVAATLAAAGVGEDSFALWRLVLDRHGLGGAFGLGGWGGASARHPRFAGLGKGRWHATDGGAYAGATDDAIRHLAGCHEPQIAVAFDECAGQSVPVLKITVDHRHEEVRPHQSGECYLYPDGALLQEGWGMHLVALTGYGLLVSSGAWAHHEPHFPCRFDTNAGGWAAAYDAVKRIVDETS